MRIAAGSLLCLVYLATLGCASSWLGRSEQQNALKEAQRKYTELVRWGEIETASAYVDPAIVPDFLDNAEAFEHIRFTDFESGPLEFSDDAETATISVVYHAYSTRTLVEKKFREDQQWYREESANNGWRVRSNLDRIAKNLGGSR